MLKFDFPEIVMKPYKLIIVFHTFVLEQAKEM